MPTRKDTAKQKRIKARTYFVDKFELAKVHPLHLYRALFWHGDGSPAIPVAILDLSDPEALVEQVANALACAHMGALPGAYSLTPEKDCRKGGEAEYMYASARAALRSLNLLPPARKDTGKRRDGRGKL